MEPSTFQERTRSVMVDKDGLLHHNSLGGYLNELRMFRTPTLSAKEAMGKEVCSQSAPVPDISWT